MNPTRIINLLLRLFTGQSPRQRWASLIALFLTLISLAAGYHVAQAGGQAGRASKGDVLQGTVVGVSDGDTLTLLDANKQQYRIRLAFIDAPEKSQPYGQASKQYLSDLVYDQTVQVNVMDIDKYGRVVGRVWSGGGDVNYAQVMNGFAWHYLQFARKSQDGESFSLYEAAQQAAISQRAGLWQQDAPQPPWDYRHQKKAGSE